MTMGLIRLDLNTKGVNQVLTREVKPDIERRARAVAARASAGMTDPAGMTVVDASDARRCRFIVLTTTTEAKRAEANDRRLTAAIDAGR